MILNLLTTTMAYILTLFIINVLSIDPTRGFVTSGDQNSFTLENSVSKSK